MPFFLRASAAPVRQPPVRINIRMHCDKGEIMVFFKILFSEEIKFPISFRAELCHVSFRTSAIPVRQAPTRLNIRMHFEASPDTPAIA